MVARGLRRDAQDLATGVQRTMTPTARLQDLAVDIELDQDIAVDEVLGDVEDDSGMELERELPMWNPEIGAIRIRITTKKGSLLKAPTLSG